MESDEDFLAPSQFARTQYRSPTNLSQTVTSSSNQPYTSRGPMQPSQARTQVSSQNELSQIHEGLKFLMDRVQQLSGDSRGIKRPAEAKPLNNQPNVKQECHVCHKLYANKTTLFRHYRAIHKEMNPEKYHGCSVNDTVVSLDTSFREIQCSICGYIALTQNSLDNHNRSTHSNENNANTSRAAVNNENVNNENVNVNIKYKMHKCDDCACYFEERSKFDKHMKAQHGFEVVCKICNKHFFFEDIDKHVKDSHPDVYNKKRKEKNENVIVEKVMKNRKGKRVRVFICTKCDIKMYDKVVAKNHARGHKKGLTMKEALRNRMSVSEENITVVTSNDNVILTCVDCNISTGSYDAAVEHSQAHITNAKATQFVTQLCEICDLKFEPLCYKKHIDLHYKDKEIHRESFKYFKYQFKLLPSENWFKCFDTADPDVKKIITDSIYEHTRLVKMRVLHEGKYKLYKCCKCDDFVEPTAVLNHTVNYDTCIKVKSSYPCSICKRTFNNRLARNNHVKNHKKDDEYKIVLFNHENDKELNAVLKGFKFENTAERADNSNANDVTKMLYKCLCGLCFVRKETAHKHKIICPGKDDKNPCPKCNNLFTQEELVTHCFEHHLIESRIVIENITPDIIVIDSDEEIIEIDSSDEDDTRNENLDNIKIEVIRPDAEKNPGSSSLVVHKENSNTQEAVVTEADIGKEEQMASNAPVLEIEKVENDDEDEGTFDQEFGELDHEMTDDSQNTISYENTENGTNAINRADININKQGELKLVPTNFLLNPFLYETGFFRVADMEMINTEINTDIENVRLDIETTTDNPFDQISIKKEKSWLFDPTDFSNICRRPSLRQITVQPSSNNLSLQVESLLTDDEETDINPDSQESANNDLSEEYTDINMSNTAPTVKEQTSNGMTGVELLNVTNDAIQNGTLNIEEERDRNENNAVTSLTALNKDSFQKVNSNNSIESLDKEVENNEDDDDDLFLPSGVVMKLNNNEKEIHKVINADQVVHSLSSEKGAGESSHITNIETETENISAGEIGLQNARSDNENNDGKAITDSNTNQTDIDKDIYEANERQDNTVDSGDFLREAVTNTNYIQPVISKETVENTIVTKPTEIQLMNINIKRELIAENERDAENCCDIDNRVRIKNEPNDIFENDYNENKENDHVVNEVEIENYSNCCVV